MSVDVCIVNKEVPYLRPTAACFLSDLHIIPTVKTMAMNASRIEPITHQKSCSYYLSRITSASASQIVPKFRRYLSPLRGIPVRLHAPKAAVAVSLVKSYTRQIIQSVDNSWSHHGGFSKSSHSHCRLVGLSRDRSSVVPIRVCGQYLPHWRISLQVDLHLRESSRIEWTPL